MRYLIDGHNLIGQMSDIRLDDPDDEAKLAAQLRGFCLRTGKGCTVVFDRGLPGGRSRPLSGGGVDVVFAHGGTNADNILLERIRAAADPGQWTVVSADRQVTAAARQRRIEVLGPAAFLALLRAPDLRASEGDKPQPSPGDTAQWLEVFDPEGDDN